MKPVELDLDAIPKRPRARAVKTPNRKTADWRRIVRSLRVDGPQTVLALARNLNIAVGNVDWILQIYMVRAVVERVGRRYRLTAKHADEGKPRPRRAPGPRSKRPTAWTKIDADD